MMIPSAATSLLGGALERYCIMIGAVRVQDGVGHPGWLGSMDLVGFCNPVRMLCYIHIWLQI